MSLAVLKIEKARSFTRDPDEFYRTLTNRNFHFVSAVAQSAIQNMKVLVAGCGSGGGAIIEPLARLGVTHMRIADSGSYELTNYNRQRAYVDTLGRNKAAFHLEALKRLNPYIDAHAFEEGISTQNAHDLARWADVVFDCVDVTSREAILMKFKLHEACQQYRRPTFVPLDVGFCQTGIVFDYRNPSVQALGGKLREGSKIENPIKAFLSFFPLSRIPDHVLPLVEDVLEEKPMPVSQLGVASDLLSAVAASAIIRLAETGEAIQDWHFDMAGVAMAPRARLAAALQAPFRRYKIRKVLRLKS